MLKTKDEMLNNKTIWITGASSGIGEACAYLWAKSPEKVNLILTATRADRLTEVQQECIRLGARCEILPYDLSDPTHIDTLTDNAVALFGRIDIAFLNAGISQRGKTLETDFQVDRKIMDVNFFAPVRITKRLLPKMIEKGGGTIAVTSSIAGRFGFPLRSAYASSKFALYGFFETVHAEYYDENIRVVMVCPGRVRTQISFNALEADGTKHGRMDEGQQKGITAEKAARKIVKAIKQQKPEVLVGGPELLMVYIKRFIPSLSRRLVRQINAT
ncbi:SDR family NAD(P)-dependent oxidoreductase [Proteiniphilum sp. UBA1028]|jgi:short-subunit dehydrogenase|uniref:SDR family NAD(P)-dependent oxidoreductase n=1 Tax=Proteiniphilum sp. UBA1028 TaxID=1947251 RepID=UPI0025F9B581|nr:SDR family NAD(P)-dependent oxidoreductase [Proteiniphilum sp. UBA1028]